MTQPLFDVKHDFETDFHCVASESFGTGGNTGAFCDEWHAYIAWPNFDWSVIFLVFLASVVVFRLLTTRK